MSNPLVALLVKALRDAGHAVGEPIPSYYSHEMRIDLHEKKEQKVARIVGKALSEIPPELRDPEDEWTIASCALTVQRPTMTLTSARLPFRVIKFTKPRRGSKKWKRIAEELTFNGLIPAMRAARQLTGASLVEARNLCDEMRERL